MLSFILSPVNLVESLCDAESEAWPLVSRMALQLELVFSLSARRVVM